jgi:hypothetical protein
MFHLSVSVDTVPQRVILRQRHAVQPLEGCRRTGFSGRPCPPGGGRKEAVPTGRHGCAARPVRLPPQPYTQRQSPDVPPQSPVQGLPPGRESTASRPTLPRPAAPVAGTARGGSVPESRPRRAGPPRPYAGPVLGWLMFFMVIYCCFIHNPGCSTLISSSKDILPNAAFRSQCSCEESSQVEFVAPNTPTVNRKHLMPVWPLRPSSATQIVGLTQMP